MNSSQSGWGLVGLIMMMLCLFLCEREKGGEGGILTVRPQNGQRLDGSLLLPLVSPIVVCVGTFGLFMREVRVGTTCIMAQNYIHPQSVLHVAKGVYRKREREPIA